MNDAINRIYRFNLSEINSFIAASLMDVIGPEAQSNNYKPIIITLVHYHLNETTEFPRTYLTHLLYAYTQDERVIDDLIGNSLLLLKRLIHSIEYTYRDPARFFFDVTIDQEDELIIEATHIDLFKAPYDQNNEWGMEFDPYTRLKETIKMDLDNGDWVNPKLRALVGE